MVANYRSVVFKHQALLDIGLVTLLWLCIVIEADECSLKWRVMRSDSAARCGAMHDAQRRRPLDAIGFARGHRGASPHHWQASQSGLSIEQNLMSLPGDSADDTAAPIAGAPSDDAPLELDTAFIAPAVTVDFSACVAPMVRR
jgi:hypothetical protein